MILMISVFAFVLVEVSMTCFSLITSGSNMDRFKSEADTLSATVARVIDVDKFVELKSQVQAIYDASENKPLYEQNATQEWEDYIAQYSAIENSELFKSTQAYLRSIQEVNSEDIDCIYLVYVDEKNKTNIYLCDSASEGYYPPGTIDEVYSFNYYIFEQPGVGYRPYTLDYEGYHLVCAGSAIYKDDVVVGYAMVDISLEHIRGIQRDNIMRLFWWLLASSIVATLIAVMIVYYSLVRPVRRLTDAALKYDVRDLDSTHDRFMKLQVNTRDELEDLTESFKKMEGDVHTKINELIDLNKKLDISEKETEKMTEIANKDALTGVRSKTAYDADAAEIDHALQAGEYVNFGIAMIDLNDLKVINDVYGHANGDIALIKLSNLICAVFVHSSVYRVGGDEFVVIVRNAEYRKVKAAIDEFNGKIAFLQDDEDLPPAERTFAALGYATYDPKLDTCVKDVYNRADHAMYAHKHEMKEKRSSKQAKN